MKEIEVIDLESTTEFDKLIELDCKTDVCALCKGGHVVGLEMKKWFNVENEIDDEDEGAFLREEDGIDASMIWASRYSIAMGGRRTFMHYFCAYYSPQAILHNNKWSDLRREIHRSRSMKCKVCNRKGATIGCFESKCGSVFHLPCLMQLDCSKFQNSMQRAQFFCEEHSKQREQKELSLDKSLRMDMSKGREAVPIRLRCRSRSSPVSKDSALVDSLAHLEGKLSDSDSEDDHAEASIQVSEREILSPISFEYITRNVDSAAVSSAYPVISQLNCCTCDGLCNNVNTCACLRYSRAYTNEGRLIEILETEASDVGSIARKPIVECNARCACSTRRCTNRVVGGGLKHSLEVFEKVSQLPISEKDVSSLDDYFEECWDLEDCSVPVKKYQCKLCRKIIKSKKHLIKHALHTCKVSSNIVTHTGWGVRTLEPIKKGAFVCEVTGQYTTGRSIITYFSDNSLKGGSSCAHVLSTHDPDSFNSYYRPHAGIFPITVWEQSPGPEIAVPSVSPTATYTSADIDGHSSKRARLAENSQDTRDSPKSSIEESMDNLICLDCRFFGNVGRFINTTSSRLGSEVGRIAASANGPTPDLVRKLVFVNGSEVKHARLALFARRDIRAGTELFM